MYAGNWSEGWEAGKPWVNDAIYLSLHCCRTSASLKQSPRKINNRESETLSAAQRSPQPASASIRRYKILCYISIWSISRGMLFPVSMCPSMTQFFHQPNVNGTRWLCGVLDVCRLGRRSEATPHSTIAHIIATSYPNVTQRGSRPFLPRGHQNLLHSLDPVPAPRLSCVNGFSF